MFYSNRLIPFTGYKQKGLTKNRNICIWIPDQLGNGVTPRAGISLIAVQGQHGKGRRVRLKPLTHIWSFLDKCVRAAQRLVCASFPSCLGESKGPI